MTKPATIRLQDLPAQKVAKLLAKQGSELKLEDLLKIEKIVEQLGGFEQARDALTALDELREVA